MKKIKKLSSKLIYENPWIRIREDDVVFPNGINSIYSTVEYVSGEGGGWVVALDEENNIILVNQYRYPIDRFSLEIPGGHTEKWEKLIDAMKREFIEETWYESVWEEVFLWEHYELCSVLKVKNSFFLFTKVKKVTIQKLEELEDVEVVIIPYEEALKKVDNWEIFDSNSIIWILKAERFLQRKKS